MKKKILSLIIAMILLISPFGMFLNVHATGVTITVDANGKVTNNTGVITVYDVNTEQSENAYQAGYSDTFKAYKVLDAYYNSTTNEISYQFTTAFQAFVNSLTVTFIRNLTDDNTKNTFTVNDYLDLTSDRDYVCTQWENDTCSEAYTEDASNTASTLNTLVSKFATYIRNNAGGANAVTGLPMTNGNYDQDDDPADARLTGVVPGSYLILPDTVTNRSFTEISIAEARYVYGVMVANVEFTIDNGEWQINDAVLHSKAVQIATISGIYDADISDNINVFDSDNDYLIMQNPSLEIGREYMYFGFEMLGTINPINANTSLINNETIAQKLKTIEITFPQGVNYDPTKFYAPVDITTNFSCENGHIYAEENNTQVSYGTCQISSNVITIVLDDNFTAFLHAIDISLNQNAVVGPTGNNLTIKTYALKDPYMDIGSNPTSQQIEAAVDEITSTTVFYTYGIKLSNTNGNNNLVGAEFAVYKDAQCTEQVGSNIVLSNANVDQNGIVYFKGLNGTDTYYLKQIKAPTGYRLNSQVITLKPTYDEQGFESGWDTPVIGGEDDPEGGLGLSNSLKEVKVKRLSGENEFEVNLDEYGYYDLTGNNAIQNQPILALPFTGGSGTVIYTLIGLFVVIGSITFMALYKKKTKKEVIEEL